MNFAHAAVSKNFTSAASALLFAGAVLASGMASATTISLGTVAVEPADATSITVDHVKGSFTDTINFTIATSALDSAANNLQVSVNNKVSYDIVGLSYKLFTAAGTQIGGIYSGDNTTYSSALTAGNSYYFTVTGNATGTSGGLYGLSLLTAAVPEPETYAMMLAGLGLVGFMAARRKAKNAA